MNQKTDQQTGSKNRTIHPLPTRNTSHQEDMWKLKVEGWKRIVQANGKTI